jgi:hypothetical protein
MPSNRHRTNRFFVSLLACDFLSRRQAIRTTTPPGRQVHSLHLVKCLPGQNRAD